jgi:hypothetical protein
MVRRRRRRTVAAVDLVPTNSSINKTAAGRRRFACPAFPSASRYRITCSTGMIYLSEIEYVNFKLLSQDINDFELAKVPPPFELATITI